MTNNPVAIVTGGAGFIGSHMVDVLLAHGYAVRVIDNMTGGRIGNLAHVGSDQNLVVEEADTCDLAEDASLFKDAKYVFHFAGIGDIVPSIESPTEYMATNVIGTAKVLECARAANVKKLVYAASSSCYGLADVPTSEAHRIEPQYPYALSKNLGEQSAFHWHNVYGLPVNSVRIFNAYGPRVRTTGAYGAVFGVFFKQKLAGVPLTVVGDGMQRRDFIYVTDVAKGFLAAAETSFKGETYNIGADNPQSVNRLVELLGCEAQYIPKRPGEPDCTWADITKARIQLNWQPVVSFEDGVARMLEDINEWRDAPLWTPETIAEATDTWFKTLS